MTATPDKLPEVVDFPDPRIPDFPDPRKPDFPDPRKREKKLSLPRPSIDSILQRTNPAQEKRRLVLPAEANKKEEIVMIDKDDPDESEVWKAQQEAARLKAESLDRMRIARELEVLLEAREKHLDKREAQLSTRVDEAIPDRNIAAHEQSLEETRRALSQANLSLEEMQSVIAEQRNELEQLKSSPEPDTSDASDALYATVTDKSLEEQVALLQEREAFIEQSENVLFDKAQHLQEWEARLEQKDQEREYAPKVVNGEA
jgi:hypothetical protein